MNLKVYQAGLKFMLVNAVKRLYNGEVIFHHSLDHGIYATIITNKVITNNIIVNVDFLSNPTYISYQAMGLYSQFLTK